MNVALIGVALVVVLLAFWLFFQSAQNRRKEEEARARMEQLQRDLQTLAGQTQNFGQQLGQLGQNVTQGLEGVTGALQKGVTDSATIAAQAQTVMANELKNSRETLGQIQQQLGAVQQAGQQMSQATQTLQNILGGAKSRGSLGEVTLERLLEDALPRERYQRQYRFSSGEAADAVVFLRDKLLPIDSKFPLEAFRRISDQIAAQALPQTEEARRAFATAVKGHADSIAKKYVLPNEGTLGIALMFVPSENVYYELLMTADAKGQPLDEYCREKNVIAVSPNTLYAHLQVILMGLQGMQIEENAKRLHASLAGIEKQMDNFADVFEKLGTHLKNAQQSYGEADKRFEKAHNALEGMLGVGTADATLEDPQDPLALPEEASAKKSA
ncbi:MAG TPA: DNA recombination protein RmuC [Candidatus Acidoferrum sp.]|nr:DNA recombination protein RmuC [Candidatus Acidoferrum sp.]